MTRLGLLALALTLITCANSLERYIEDADRFPGWKGELPSIMHEEAEDGTVGFGELGRVSCRGGLGGAVCAGAAASARRRGLTQRVQRQQC